MQTIPIKAQAEHLSMESLSRFREDGLILLKNVFTPEDYTAIFADLAERTALLERYYKIPQGPLMDDADGLSRRIIRLEQEFPGSQAVLYDSINNSPAIHNFGTHEKLLKIIRTLLGSPTVEVHPRFILLMSMPENEWHLATWHQDWFYNEGPYSTLTLYAPLQYTNEENGSLLMAPGADKRGFIEHGEYDHGVKTKWHSLPPEAVNSFDPVISTELDAGDILLFNSLVPHCARLNRSENIRFVVNLRYRDLTDPTFMEKGWRIGYLERARQALARKENNA